MHCILELYLTVLKRETFCKTDVICFVFLIKTRNLHSLFLCYHPNVQKNQIFSYKYSLVIFAQKFVQKKGFKNI